MAQNILTIQNVTNPPQNISIKVGGKFFKATPGQTLTIDLANLELTVKETEDLNNLISSSSIKAYLNSVLMNTIQVTGMAYDELKGDLELNETTEDLDYYVDGSTGNDSNSGTQASPFKTFAFMRKLPTTLRHKVHVHISAGTYTYFPDVLDFKYEDDGLLVLDASSETFPVTAGPFTINSVTGVGAAGPYGLQLATDLNVSSPGWTGDAYKDKFIHMTSGATSGAVFPIFKNTTDTIRTHVNFGGIAPTDTFNIVDCPVTIDIDHRVRFVGNFPGALSVGNPSAPTTNKSPHRVHLFIVGLSFDVDQSDRDCVVFENTNSTLNLFKVHDRYTTDAFSTAGVFINAQTNINAFATVLDNTSLETHYYIAGIQFVSDVAPTSTYNEDIKTYNSSLGGVCCRRTISAYGGSSNVLSFSLCGSLYVAGTDRLDVDYLFIEQIGFSDNAIECKNTYLNITSSYIAAGAVGFLLKDGSTCRARWLKGAAMTNASGTHVDFGSKLFTVPANVTLTGATNDYTFLQTAAVGTWPTTGLVVTDSRGAYIAAD